MFFYFYVKISGTLKKNFLNKVKILFFLSFKNLKNVA